MGFSSEQFVEKVDDNLKCTICLDVLEDPWQCRDGHTFCKACITRWLTNKQICPVGKNALQLNTLGRCLPMKNMIENLKVYCDPSQGKDAEEKKLYVSYCYLVPKINKCDWTGKLQSLAKHRETCSFQQVQCPNVNCNTNMQRRELEEHDKICKHKKVKCVKCGVVMIRLELQVHKDNRCPQEMVPCPNSCTCSPTGQMRTIKRKNLERHVINECVKTILDCPFKDQGCSAKVERQHVDKHVQDNMAEHMMLLANQCSSLTKENKQLKEEINRLKKNDEFSRTYRWEIENFSHSLSSQSSIRSPTFSLCGYSWYLEMFLKNERLVSVKLCLEDESVLHGKAITMTCRLTAISLKEGTENRSSEKSHTFKKGIFSSKNIQWDRLMSVTDAQSKYCSNSGYSIMECTIQVDSIIIQKDPDLQRSRNFGFQRLFRDLEMFTVS